MVRYSNTKRPIFVEIRLEDRFSNRNLKMKLPFQILVLKWSCAKVTWSQALILLAGVYGINLFDSKTYFQSNLVNLG